MKNSYSALKAAGGPNLRGAKVSSVSELRGILKKAEHRCDTAFKLVAGGMIGAMMGFPAGSLFAGMGSMALSKLTGIAPMSSNTALGIGEDIAIAGCVAAIAGIAMSTLGERKADKTLAAIKKARHPGMSPA